MEVKKGTVDRSETFHLRNSSDGTSKTGLLYNSAGAVASYRRTGGLSIEIPLKALSTPAPDDAHDDGGFIEIDSTLSKGDYRIDVPDAAYASGVDEVVIHLGFTGVFEESLRVTLKDNTEKDVLDAVLTRLASTVYGTDICPSAVTVTDGTILSGDVTDACTINQTYLKVQETGQFKIDFDFTGLSSTEDKINAIYRYFGEGSTNHKVECQMWNYQTSAWDDMLATEKDFPSTEQDSRVEFDIPGTVSDYFTGTSPNIAAKIRINHVSNFTTDHQFWVDFITLGELEQIYVPADNAGITAIDEAVENATYGLSALQILLDALPTVPVNILSATGYVKDVSWASGGKFYIKESEDINIPFWFEGNPTGLEIWFVIAKDLKNGPLLVKKQLVDGTDWNIVQVDGIDRVDGTLPFIYDDTNDLHGEYTAAVIVKTAADKAYTGWEATLVVSRPVAKAGALVV